MSFSINITSHLHWENQFDWQGCKLYKLPALEADITRVSPMQTVVRILLICFFVNNWNFTISVICLLTLWTSINLYRPIILFHATSNSFIIRDRLGVTLTILTLWIGAMSLAASTNILHKRAGSSIFLRLVIALTIIVTIAFNVNNFLLFYILFEAALIPILLIITMWGSTPERTQAGLYIIMYTVIGALPLLGCLLYIYTYTHRFYIYFEFVPYISTWTYLGLIVAFLIKLPVYGLHMWLPKAHVEAPVGGSILLAGVLLKLGPYGIMRLFYMYPNSGVWCKILLTLGLIGALIGALVCIRQLDFKSLIAYASVRHISLTLAGLATIRRFGWWGAKLILIAHGLVSAGLFLIAGAVYDNRRRRSLHVNRGLLVIAPASALFWFIMVCANIGVPPTLNIGSEVSLFAGLISIERDEPIMALLLIIYSTLTILYRLSLYTGLHHGEPSVHTNFYWQYPIIYSIASILLIPTVLLFFCMPSLL